MFDLCLFALLTCMSLCEDRLIYSFLFRLRLYEVCMYKYMNDTVTQSKSKSVDL
jgi:hypothetical protein